jgi:hypothetical protein
MQTNYEKAVEIYEAQGQSAVFDAVLSGTLTATSWHWCEPCECESPHEDKTCLVCGTESEPKTVKQKIIELLDDYSSYEIPRLVGMNREAANKLVHEIYTKDWGLNDPKFWEAEMSGDVWAIYGKDFAGEWIDECGEYLCFDTEAEANQYIKETMQ